MELHSHLHCTLQWLVNQVVLHQDLPKKNEVLIHYLLIYCIHSYMSSTVTMLYSVRFGWHSRNLCHHPSWIFSPLAPLCRQEQIQQCSLHLSLFYRIQPEDNFSRNFPTHFFNSTQLGCWARMSYSSTKTFFQCCVRDAMITSCLVNGLTSFYRLQSS